MCDTICIEFVDAINQDIEIQIYWSNDDDGITGEHVVSYIIDRSSRIAMFNLNEYVCDLRLDIGTAENTTFKLKKVYINRNITVKDIGDILCTDIVLSHTDRVFWERVKIIFAVGLCIAIFFLVGYSGRKYLFRHRWGIACVILFFLCINKYHGDSISLYSNYIQKNQVSEFMVPIIGEERAIRSDEWVVDNPSYLSSQFLDEPYGKRNNIIRGTESYNQNHLSWYSVCEPLKILRASINSLFGWEYGYSFYWYGRIIFTFLINLELFLILTKNRRLISVCGACMVVLSSWYMWWGFPSEIMYMPAALVSAFYFFESKTYFQKILFALSTSIFTAGFVVILYPAWQVPFAYIALTIFGWSFYIHWDKIRKYNVMDWIIILVALICVIILVFNVLWSKKDYLESITNTVYPGARQCNGGFYLNKINNYLVSILFPYKDSMIPSVYGIMTNLFPLGFVMYIYSKIKKKSDSLVNALFGVNIFLLIYVTIGFGPIFSKLTLMSFSTETRAIDVFAYAQVLLVIVLFSRIRQEDKMKWHHSFILAIIMMGIILLYVYKSFNWYVGWGYIICAFAIGVTVVILLITNFKRKYMNIALYFLIIFSIIQVMCVRPICKGFDAIYKKDVAKEIQHIMSKDRNAKWIAYGGTVVSSFAVACGAPTITNVNTYPDLELWNSLDEEGLYKDVYNRYAHIAIEFTEEKTSFELVEKDAFMVNLSYNDLQKIGVDYIFSICKLDVNNEYAYFDEIYSQDCCYIYKVINR